MASPTASSAAAEVQALLRFLSQEARVPLPTALSKINDLRKAQLHNPEAISRSTVPDLCPIFNGDDKVAKQVLAAAKRVSNPKSKKRVAPPGNDGARTSSSKRSRGPPQQNGYAQSPAELEASLALPCSSLSIAELQSVTIQTNRAPLLLAFAVTVLKYTMPEQPLSSRLSLAQAVVSANSRSKAVSIGLIKEGERRSAEEEGWGDGQPKVRVLGRSVAVMRRVGYDPVASREGVKSEDDGDDDDESQATVGHEGNYIPGGAHAVDQEPRELPLWGLDLEALRKSNGPALISPGTARKGATATTTATAGLPIYTPQSARSYLLKSFTMTTSPSQPPSNTEPNPKTSSSPSPTTAKSKKSTTAQQQHSTALSHLLRAVDLLCASWTGTTLDRDEFDRRAWAWYVRVRPDVATGESGWGQRGGVALGGIVGLMRREEEGGEGGGDKLMPAA